MPCFFPRGCSSSPLSLDITEAGLQNPIKAPHHVAAPLPPAWVASSSQPCLDPCMSALPSPSEAAPLGIPWALLEPVPASCAALYHSSCWLLSPAGHPPSSLHPFLNACGPVLVSLRWVGAVLCSLCGQSSEGCWCCEDFPGSPVTLQAA